MISIGYEDLAALLIDLVIAVVLGFLYFRTRNSNGRQWLKHFGNAMGLMSLNHMVPYILILLSIIFLGDKSEAYVALISTTSYLLLSGMACYCLIEVYRARNLG